MAENRKTPAIRFNGFNEAWEQRKLGDAFTQTVGYVNPKLENIELWSLTLEKGLTPKTERYIRDFLVLKEDKYKEVCPNDVVYNPMNMTLGAIGYNDMPITVAVSGYYVTMKPANSINGYYIKTWMQLPQSIELYKAHATGSLLEKQRVQYPTFSEIKFTVPSLNEQQKIGEFFRNLDTLITLHQGKFLKIKNIKKAMLEKMFPQDGQNTPEIRFSGFTDAWEQRKLSEVINDIADGPFGSNLKTVHYTDEREARIIQLSNIGESGWQDENVRYTTFEHAKEIKRCIVQENELVMAKMMPAGLTIERPNTDKMYVLSSDAVRIKLNDILVDSKYFVCITKSNYFLDQVNNDSQGSTRTRTSISKIKEMQISTPILQEQKKIGEFFSNLDNLITLHQRKLDKLNNIKKACLEKMFI